MLIVLLAALFFWLTQGIEIDKLDVGRYKIEGLYIKLDKKLTLKAKEITLPKNKAAPSFGRIDKTFDQIKYLLTFFDTIMLEKINFENNHVTLLYADDVLYITSDEYEIAGNIERKGTKLIADVSLLYIKGYRTTLSGKLSYDLRSNELETGGKFETFGIEGHFRAVKKNDLIVYALNTRTFNDPRPLIERLKMDPAIESWIIDKVHAKAYKVEFIKGKMTLDGQKVKMDFASLKGKIRFDDVTIRYKDGIPPAQARALLLEYKKGNLYFELLEPYYQGRDLNGTNVVIKHIVGVQSPVLILQLHAVTPIDTKVEEILHAYGLEIPVTHTGKKNRVEVMLKIPLGRTDKKLTAKVNAELDKGLLRVDKFAFHVRGGRIVYEDKEVLLKGVQVDEKWYRGGVNGKIKLANKEADLLLDATQLMLGEQKEPVLEIKKKKIPLQLFYGKVLRLKLPSLQADVTNEGKKLKVRLSDLARIIPFLRRNLLGVKGGELLVETDDMIHYRFKGRLRKDACFFYDKANICYTSIPVEGSLNSKNGKIDLYAFNKRLHVDVTKSVVKIRNLNIDLKLFLEAQKKVRQKKGKQLVSHKPFVILGKNSYLRYGPYKLILDSYDIEVSPNGNIKAMGSLDGDVVKFTKKGDNFFMQALRVKDKLLHPLINFSGLKNGRYSLKKEGNPDKVMKGRIIIEGGVLSDFKAYSNTLAFVNTLPALATLSNPGFSDKGFKITEGVIEYTMTPEKITFTSVYLKGNSATVLGKGTVDLKTKKIDVDLAILTVREFGKIVGKIPLLGYILMGDDNSMTVGLKITGTLDDPKVNTSVAKDILTLPLQILKRTITAPAHMGKPVAPTDLPPKDGPKTKKQKPKPSTQRDRNVTIPSMTRPELSESRPLPSPTLPKEQNMELF
jgi:hypothetical protein